MLGCDGSWPGPGGAGSGYLVEAGGTVILLDAGPGTFARLQQWGDPGRIDAVVLTHEHPDHWSDLESFATWTSCGSGVAGYRRRRAPLLVYAPPGLRRWSHYQQQADVVAWREVEPRSELLVGQLALRFDRTDHGPPTLAVRLAHGEGTLVYSADTGTGWSMADAFGPGIGTFLCEATYTAEREGSFKHLSGREAAVMASAADVGRLILTHRWPTVSAEAVRTEAEASFGPGVEQAHDGAVFAW
ncbi:MAG TPA: MBL fold metallo-hydrolase [Acidimicrobiales bacterium]